MFGEYEDSDSFFHQDSKELKAKIIQLLDKDKIQTDKIINSEKLKKLFTPNDSIFDTKLKETIKSRIPKNLAKYDKVIDLIKSSGKISKKELINSLWSFHCNSNFQKMRWKLLFEDKITDETSNKETIYNA
jgi:hypothetical protein